MEIFIDGLVDNLIATINHNMWLAPLLALLAGVLTSFTPCCLSTVPLIIGYVGGVGADAKKSLRLSLLFALGSAITFTTLGVIASLMGRLMGGHGGGWWYLLLGVLMVLMALQTWEIFNFIPSTYLQSKNKRRSYVGAFLTGIMAGLFSSPCATPVLVALLAMVAQQGNVAWGVLLLLLYSLGHGILSVIAGTSTGFVRKLTDDARYGKISNVLKIVLGSVILLLGFYMFYLGF